MPPEGNPFMCSYRLARLLLRKGLLRQTFWIVLVLATRSSLLHAAPSIFDDDWKPATLPANRAEPKTDQPDGQPANTVPNVTPPKHANLPPEIKPNAVRARVPEKRELAATRKLFRELFQKDLADGSSNARHSLALKLMGEAARCQDKPLDQYVLYAAAYQAAVDAEDLGLCFDAINDLSAAFEVDGLAMKAQALIAGGLKAATPAAAYDKCRVAIPVLAELIEAEDYATAGKMARLLQTAANGDAFLKPAVAKWIKTLEVNRVSFDRYAKARQKLRTAPDDAAAKEDVGAYLCFCKGDWQKGLPWLAGGTQPDVQNLARKEMNGPTESDALEQLAAGWAAVAAKQADGYRQGIREHAIDLYRKALIDTTGLQKRTIDLAIEKVAAAIGPQWVDLLALIESDKDSVRGKWSRSGITLIGEGHHDRLELPYIPPAEYAFRIDFTPTRNVDGVFMGIYAGDKTFLWVMGNAGNQFADFQDIDGKDLESNKTVRKLSLVAGQRYAAVVEVRNKRLKAFVNGEQLVDWPTTYQEFSASRGDWQPRNPLKLAIGDWTTTTVFHRVEVMELSGSGTVSR
jgi:hypothetical protein